MRETSSCSASISGSVAVLISSRKKRGDLKEQHADQPVQSACWPIFVPLRSGFFGSARSSRRGALPEKLLARFLGESRMSGSWVRAGLRDVFQGAPLASPCLDP